MTLRGGVGGWGWWDVESTRGHCNVFSGTVKIHQRKLNRKSKDPRLVTVRTIECGTCLSLINYNLFNRSLEKHVSQRT